jgi:hypothetical protein
MSASMIQYHWHEEISETFGSIRRPVAEVHLRDAKSNWHALTMYIDSGADVSIISKSFGELFGYNLKKGRKIKLKGIGPMHIIAYLHKMDLLIGQHEIRIDVAIADNDDVPNVLGRRTLFDLFEIQFKNLKQQTWFLKK